MDTTIVRFTLAAVAMLAAAYLIWPQIAVWLDRVKEPGCGKCRYPVAGITGLRCPECGGDLRQVGILTPSMMVRRAAGPRTRVAAWTLIWAVVGIAAAVAVQALVSGRFLATRTSPVQLVADAGISVQIGQRAEGWSMEAAERTLVLTLLEPTRPERFGEFTITWPDRVVTKALGTAVGGEAGVGGVLSDDAAAAWLARAGVPGAESAGPQLMAVVEAVAAQPVNMATDVAVGGAWTYLGSSIGVRPFTPWWVQAGGGGLWLIAWMIGMLGIVRRRRSGGDAAGRVPATA